MLRARPRARPGMKMFAFGAIILGLAYGVANQAQVKKLLGTRSRGVRTVLPLGVQIKAAPVFSKPDVDASIVRVQPKVGACLAAWPASTGFELDRFEVEVVMTSDGPVEAAMRGPQPIPAGVARCVGAALGTETWPATKWLRKVRFSPTPSVPTSG